ncbi:MAG: hypothetical protein LBF56_03835 [Holosporales bacterium]|nr:hypothetical protein [Holosporales bacterium]
MNLKCPYCNCCYEVSDSLLQNPSMDHRLGYGWWLRCYKCGRKWWLDSTTYKLNMPSPPMASKEEKIARLSAPSGGGRRRIRKRSFFGKAKWYLVMAGLVSIAACLICQNKAKFQAYLVNKARHITETTIKKIMMTDIKYFIEPGDKLLVTGAIVNEDSVVAKVAGVKVAVYSGNTEVIAWQSDLSEENILPGQRTTFSTEKQLPQAIPDIRVEVSLF